MESILESDDPYNFDESNDNDKVIRPVPPATAHLHFDGHIPEFWGVQYIEGPDRAECNNSFRFMLSSHIYYSEHSNSVFTGQSASDTSLYKRDYDRAYSPSLENQVYARAPRGILRDPFKVNRLLTILND